MLKEILQKFFARKQGDYNPPERLDPDEVELQSYLQEERKKRIKKMAQFYRAKKAREFWHGNSILKNDRVILTMKNQLEEGRT